MGISKLTSAVKSTLGPSGRVVLASKDFGDPYFTKDGVTVAREIELPDYLENMGAQIVRQATSKTASSAGDGTTTATIYVEAIFEAGLQEHRQWAKAHEVKRGIEKAVNAVVEEPRRTLGPSPPQKNSFRLASVRPIRTRRLVLRWPKLSKQLVVMVW